MIAALSSEDTDRPQAALFDEATLRKLSRLTLVASQVRAGVLKGERRSTKRGASLEFADYRSYTPGDDLRRLDWKAYARLDRPFLKLFEEEEDLAVMILLDASRSMDWGEGEQHKFRYGLKLAAALGSIALGSGDRLIVQTLREGRSAPPFGPARGAGSTLRLLQYLEAQTPGGRTALDRALRDLALTPRRPGLVVLLSDLLSPDGFPGTGAGLGHLQGHGDEIALIHLLAPDEVDPPLSGDLRLVDVETGEAQDVTLDGGLRDLYHRRLEAWQEEIAAGCRRRGVRYLGVTTGQPWERVVLQELRRVKVVR